MDWDDDYEDDNGSEDRSDDYEALTGTPSFASEFGNTIGENLDDILNVEGDMADDWLAQHDAGQVEQSGPEDEYKVNQQQLLGGDQDLTKVRTHNDNEEDVRVGGASRTTLAQHRAESLGVGVQIAIEAAVHGNLDGTAGRQSKADIAKWVDKGREAYGNIEGLTQGVGIRDDMRPGEVKTVSRDQYHMYGLGQLPESEVTYESTRPSKPSQQDVAMAKYIIENPEAYENTGPGSALEGHIPTNIEGQSEGERVRNEKKQHDADVELVASFNDVAGLAVRYMHADTIAAMNSPDAGIAEQAQNAFMAKYTGVYNDLMTRGLSGANTEAASIVPLPNEIGGNITGLTPTVAYYGANKANLGVGTTRLGYELEQQPGGYLHGWDDNALFGQRPNLMSSLVRVTGDERDGDHNMTRVEQKEKWTGIKGTHTSALETIKGQLGTIQQPDLNGNNVYGEAGYLRDEAAVLDLNTDRTVVETQSAEGSLMFSSSRNTYVHPDFVGPQQKDSGSNEAHWNVTGGRSLFNIKGIKGSTDSQDTWMNRLSGLGSVGRGGQHEIHHNDSEQDEYMRLRSEGVSPDQALSQALTSAEAISPNNRGEVYTVPTEREVYQAWAADQPAQGTPEWLALREGLHTASNSKGMVLKKGNLSAARIRDTAVDIVTDRPGMREYKKPFVPNSAMVEGNVGEGHVKAAFMASIATKGEQIGTYADGTPKYAPTEYEYDFEEAFFETNDDYPGMGASPDGRLYNPKSGASEGLVEFKHLGNKTMPKIAENYYAQAQHQMMIAKEDKVILFGLDKNTGQLVSETIYADEEYQATLARGSKMAHEQAATVKTKEGLDELKNKRSSVQASLPRHLEIKQEELSPEEVENQRFVADEEVIMGVDMTVFDPDSNATPSAPTATDASGGSSVSTDASSVADVVENIQNLTNGKPKGAAERKEVSKKKAEAERLQKEEAHNRKVQEALGSSWSKTIEDNIKATKKKTEADQKAAAAADLLTNSVGKAGGAFKVMGELGNSMIDSARRGLDAGSDARNRGASRGLSTQEQVSLNMALAEQGVDEKGQKTISNAVGDLNFQTQSLDGASSIKVKAMTAAMKSLNPQNVAAAQSLDHTKMMGMSDAELLKMFLKSGEKIEDLGDRAFYYDSIHPGLAAANNMATFDTITDQVEVDGKALLEQSSSRAKVDNFVLRRDFSAGTSEVAGAVVSISDNSKKVGILNNATAQAAIGVGGGAALVTGKFDIPDYVNDALEGMGLLPTMEGMRPKDGVGSKDESKDMLDSMSDWLTNGHAARARDWKEPVGVPDPTIKPQLDPNFRFYQEKEKDTAVPVVNISAQFNPHNYEFTATGIGWFEKHFGNND